MKSHAMVSYGAVAFALMTANPMYAMTADVDAVYTQFTEPEFENTPV